jgi:hypothetical protein
MVEVDVYLSGVFCRLQVPFAVQERGSTADASSGSPGVLVCQQKEKDHNASRKVRNDAVPTKLSRRCRFVSLVIVHDSELWILVELRLGWRLGVNANQEVCGTIDMDMSSLELLKNVENSLEPRLTVCTYLQRNNPEIKQFCTFIGLSQLRVLASKPFSSCAFCALSS